MDLLILGNLTQADREGNVLIVVRGFSCYRLQTHVWGWAEIEDRQGCGRHCEGQQKMRPAGRIFCFCLFRPAERFYQSPQARLM